MNNMQPTLLRITSSYVKLLYSYARQCISMQIAPRPAANLPACGARGAPGRQGLSALMAKTCDTPLPWGPTRRVNRASPECSIGSVQSGPPSRPFGAPAGDPTPEIRALLGATTRFPQKFSGFREVVNTCVR